MDHQRKIKTVSDETILEWINAGNLVVKYINRRDPVIINRGRVLSPYLVRSSGSERTRWAVHLHSHYVAKKTCRCRKVCKHPVTQIRIRRNIIRSKLVWMFKERRLLPLGHEVHHIDLDRYNDRGRNLIDLIDTAHYNEHHSDDVPF